MPKKPILAAGGNQGGYVDIRVSDDNDLPAMLAIEEAAQKLPWSRSAFERCIEAKYPGWVMEEALNENEKTMAGFVLISVKAGECHILNLCVHPDYQRQGYGEKLLVTAITWAKEQGVGIVYLEVRRSNREAIALYRKMNFKQIGERKSYYLAQDGTKEDALIFARDIGIE